VQCFGAEASTKTAELLPIGKAVELERDIQERDRYGRMLAYVWPDGTMLMLNEQLVAEGYTLALTVPPNVRYAGNFANAQRIARENGLGLWAGYPDAHRRPATRGRPPTARRRSLHRSQPRHRSPRQRRRRRAATRAIRTSASRRPRRI
jgi:endonuclease YncB( thermonuclease family)